MAFTNYDKCSLLLPMDGANNGTTFKDWSPVPKTVTRNGSAVTSTAQSKYYGSSCLFNNNVSNYLIVPYTPDFNMGTGQFTIACWLYVNAAPSTTGELFQILQVGRRSSGVGAGGYSLRLSSQTQIVLESVRIGSAVVTLAAIPSVSFGQWVHVACTRDAAGVQFFIDGIKYTGSSDFLTENVTNPSSLTSWIGVSGSTANWYSNGYIQDLLIIKGAALWTSNFTPPTRLIGELTGNIVNESGNPVQRNIIAVPRVATTRLFTTQSDISTGNYTLRCPSVDTHVAAFHEGSPQKADLIARTSPE